MGALTRFVKAAALSCLLASPWVFSKEKPKTSVADLRYGVALYHHFNEEDLIAMSELLVAKERGGIKGHGENPDIMEGGFALAYGMDDYAESIFGRVLEENRPQNVRDSAWFYLARLRYDKNDWLAADNAANNISKTPPSYLKNELVSLRVSSAIRQDKLALAEEIIANQGADRGWFPYLQFNMASAFARKQEYAKANEYFKYFSDTIFRREEHLSLYDKAMTASGYAYLFTDKAEAAAKQFSQVRLDSPLSSRALLGYGWAQSERENHTEALRAWQHLSTKSLVDENSQEALVAIPYAYEKLDKPGLALKHFKAAEVKFAKELAQIDDIMVNLQGDSLLEVLKIQRSEELDWILYAEENQLSPQLSYLVTLFSLEVFHNIVHELRDLLAIKDGYVSWQNKVSFYDEMLQIKMLERSEKKQLLLAQALSEKINQVKRRRDALVAEYNRTKNENDFIALADKRKDLHARVKKSKARIEQLRKTDPFIDESEEALRRYAGILLWEEARAFPIRLWELEKYIRKIDKTLKAMRAQYDSINTVMTETPDILPMRERLQKNSERIGIETKKIDTALIQKQGELRDKIYAILEVQRYNILQYLAQSRLSVARILDERNKKDTSVSSPQLKNIQDQPSNIEATQ